MAYCCTKLQIDDEEDNKDIELSNLKKYTILEIPNEPIICYKNTNYSTKKNLFIYEDKEYIDKNMKWIKIQGFKLYTTQRYIQCLHIKNNNSKHINKIILFNQSSYSNLASILPFLLELSNYLKMNIITYEYTIKSDEKQCIYDAKILFIYLNKITTISEIILMGFSIGNIMNMNITVSKLNKDNCKIKSIIMINPIWKFSYISEKINNKEEAINKLQKSLKIFFLTANNKNINIFLIHGKEDEYYQYNLTLSFSKDILYLSEWYPSKATHFDIINKCRAKLLCKLKLYLNNNYSLLSSQIKYLKKKSFIINEKLLDNDEYKNIMPKTLKDNNNLYDIYESGKDYKIDNNSIFYNNINNNEILSFKKGDIIPNNISLISSESDSYTYPKKKKNF